MEGKGAKGFVLIGSVSIGKGLSERGWISDGSSGGLRDLARRIGGRIRANVKLSGLYSILGIVEGLLVWAARLLASKSKCRAVPLKCDASCKVWAGSVPGGESLVSVPGGKSVPGGVSARTGLGPRLGVI